MRELLRYDGYHTWQHRRPQKLFELLALHQVQVLLCDSYRPLNGAAFLDTVKQLYPDTLRIVLSRYADLESVIAAINQEMVHRFYTKPWNEKTLRDNIREAFRHYRAMSSSLSESSFGL